MVTSTITAKALNLEDTTVVEADQFPIKSVKLFASASAETTRTFQLSFLRSQDAPQVVEIAHLPANLQSVDVSVTSTSGNVMILDHYHDSAPDPKNSFDESTPKPTLSSQTLRELAAERLRLQDEKRIRQQSFTFLTTYMDSLAQCKSQAQPEASQMVSFFDDFVQLGVTRSATMAELDSKLADLESKIAEEEERLSQLNSDLPTRVVAVLACNSHMPVEAAELTLTYVVKQISWKPAYDLHIAMMDNTPSPTVKLDFRCTVSQWTGENWENVSLALTTADQVSQLIRLPEPKGIDIRLAPVQVFPQPTRPQPQVNRPLRHMQPPPALATLHPCRAPPAFGQQQQATVIHPEGEEPTRERERALRAEISALRGSLAHQVENLKMHLPSHSGVSQLISRGSKDPITHIANGRVFIPSDRAEHHVLVASLSLQAQFMRVVVPSVDTRVYYTCEVKNTSDHVLLPGTVKAYLNDKHVSSTDIHNTELPQILECSLAIDTGVKTIHNRAPDALPSVGAFTGNATTTYTSAIVLHNTHPDPIRGVIVRSSIPLPADPRITIVLKEPAGLTEIDEGSVKLREGCLARWSTTGGRKGKQAGLFEWVCDVNPGTEVLKAVWEVCAPQDMKLFEQVH